MQSTPEIHTLKIEKMSCGGCVKNVTAALKTIAGVAVKSVEIGTAMIECESPARCDAAAAAVTAAGYPANDSSHSHVAAAPTPDGGRKNASAATQTTLASNEMVSEGDSGPIGVEKATNKDIHVTVPAVTKPLAPVPVAVGGITRA